MQIRFNQRLSNKAYVPSSLLRKRMKYKNRQSILQKSEQQCHLQTRLVKINLKRYKFKLKVSKLIKAIKGDRLTQKIVRNINKSLSIICSMRMFRIIKVIKKNSYGSISVAEHILTREKVFIKQVHKKHLKTKNNHKKLQNEIHILKMLKKYPFVI